MSEKIYIISANRTPFINSKGPTLTEWDGGDGKEKAPNAYTTVSSIKLLSTLFEDLIKRTGMDPNDLADVKVGCVSQYSEQGCNIARNASLMANIPNDVPAVTHNRLCGSSLDAIISATQQLKIEQEFESNKPGTVLVGGVEKLSEYPIDEKLFFPSKEYAEFLLSS